MSRVSFYAGPADNRALTDFAKSIGLLLLSTKLGGTVDEDDSTAFPGCILSLVPASELRLLGKPPIYLGYPGDPVIAVLRSYCEPPYLVSGNIFWEDYGTEGTALTKPYFGKLSRWIRKNWSKRPDHAFYFGPDAARMVDEEGVIPSSLPPGLEIQYVAIPSKT